MPLFVLILLILAGAGMTIGIIATRKVRQSLPEQKPVRELPQYRSLFEPTDEELRGEQLKEAVRLAEIDGQESLKLTEERLENFEKVRQTWANSPDRAGTIGLFYEASRLGQAGPYWKTCEEILKFWRAGRIGDLSSDDLAQLMESHFWLLPDNERTPGATFRLSEEIAGLRRESEEKKD